MTTNSVKNKIGHYLDNGDGTVTDTHTSLMWMRCALGQIWDGKTCTGEAGKHRYDRALTLQIAFAGHSDWRVPGIDELESIIDPNRTHPAIDISAFQNTPNRFFWSASANETPGYASAIAFSDGTALNFGDRKDSYCVRLVRGGRYSTNLRPLEDRKLDILADQELAITASEEYKHSAFASPIEIILERLDTLENRLEASISRVERLAQLLATGQSKAQESISLLLHRSTTGTSNFTIELAELREMFISALPADTTTTPTAPQCIAHPNQKFQPWIAWRLSCLG